MASKRAFASGLLRSATPLFVLDRCVVTKYATAARLNKIDGVQIVGAKSNGLKGNFQQPKRLSNDIQVKARFNSPCLVEPRVH